MRVILDIVELVFFCVVFLLFVELIVHNIYGGWSK